MITIRVNLRALLRPYCWLVGHLWKDYAVFNAWTREGRYCEWCGKQQFVTVRYEFADGETVHVRTDWNGTERFVYRSEGEGTKDDPIVLVKVPCHQKGPDE